MADHGIYCHAKVLRIQLILRKAYGGSCIVTDSRSIGAEGPANVVFRREIAAADDPEAVRAQRIKEYQQELMHPYYAAERGLVHDVIDPAGTRRVLIRAREALEALRTKDARLPSRKHGNPPM